MNVSMTWPEYLAGCCRINGHLTRLTLQEADVLLALLLGHPVRWTKGRALVETIWPNADTQPDFARSQLTVLVVRLRRHGIAIESLQGWGYRIPRHARGREQAKMAA